MDILTDDVGFSARLSGTEDVVHAPLRSDYMAERVTSLCQRKVFVGKPR